MADMSLTTEAKSDQLGADDLTGGPRTVRITSADINIGSDQPATLHYEGEDGKPFRPCKSMRRVIVKIWGKESSNYSGKSMTLYRDDKVRFGALEVGGIRISHMSNMTEAVTMALTAKKGDKKPFTVKPLATAPQKPTQPQVDVEALQDKADYITAHLDDYNTVEALRHDWDPIKLELKTHLPDVFKALNAAVSARGKELAG